MNDKGKASKPTPYYQKYKQPATRNHPTTANQAYVVTRKGQGATFVEISQELNISRQRAHQLYLQAIRKPENGS